jgi:hypothetical protein
MLKPACGPTRRAFQKQQLKPVQGAQTSSAKLGQTPLGAPEYANHNTYVVITVNRRFVEGVVRHWDRSPSSVDVQAFSVLRALKSVVM